MISKQEHKILWEIDFTVYLYMTCKECGKSKHRKYIKKWQLCDPCYQRLKVDQKKKSGICVDCNKKAIEGRIYCQDHCKYHKFRDTNRLDQKKTYYSQNKNKILNTHKVYERKQRAENLIFRLRSNLRSRLYHAVKSGQKTGSAVKDLGCSIEDFKKYIESKFSTGMNWENYGKWHLDHIIPISKFDLDNRKQFLRACHYTNLQPMWSIDNIRKSNHCDI